MFIDYIDKVRMRHEKEDKVLLEKCCKELKEEMKKLDIKFIIARGKNE